MASPTRTPLTINNIYNPGIGQTVKRIDERPRIAHANACNAILDLELTGPLLIGLTGFLNNLNS